MTKTVDFLDIVLLGEVRGVAQLGSVIYVVCRESSVVKTYSADTLSPLSHYINVEEMTAPRDMAACRRDRQLYIAELNCIWRLSGHDHVCVKWLSTESVADMFDCRSLSLASDRLLVTSWRTPSVRQYNTTDRQRLQVVRLPEYMKPWHGVETTRDTFLVDHEGTADDKRQFAVS